MRREIDTCRTYRRKSGVASSIFDWVFNRSFDSPRFQSQALAYPFRGEYLPLARWFPFLLTSQASQELTRGAFESKKRKIVP